MEVALWSVLFSLAALASDPANPWGIPPASPPAETRPLAIPAATPAPPGPPVGRERAASVRAYARRHLSVHSLSEYYATPATTSWWGGRWGGFATTTPGYVVQNQTWAVFEGEHRLDVPTYLGTIGDAAGKTALDERIATNRSAGTFFTVIGVAGLGASFAGLVGMETADTGRQLERWSTVTLAGLGTGVGGLLLGAIPSTRARRLQVYPDRTLDRRQVEDAVESYNDRLAIELGLSPEAAMRLENRQREEAQ